MLKPLGTDRRIRFTIIQLSNSSRFKAAVFARVAGAGVGFHERTRTSTSAFAVSYLYCSTRSYVRSTPPLGARRLPLYQLGRSTACASRVSCIT